MLWGLNRAERLPCSKFPRCPIFLTLCGEWDYFVQLRQIYILTFLGVATWRAPAEAINVWEGEHCSLNRWPGGHVGGWNRWHRWHRGSQVKWSNGRQVHNVVRSSPTPNLNALSRKLWSDKLICRSRQRTNLSKYSFDKWEGGVTPDPLWCQLLVRSNSDARETLSEHALALLQFGVILPNMGQRLAWPFNITNCWTWLLGN